MKTLKHYNTEKTKYRLVIDGDLREVHGTLMPLVVPTSTSALSKPVPRPKHRPA